MMAAARVLLANWKLLLVAVLLAALGVQTVRIAGLKQEAAEQRATDAETLRLAMKAQRDEFSRRQSVMDQEASRAQTQLAALRAISLILTALAAACTTPPSSPPTLPAGVPRLAPQLRQSLEASPSECLPTCLQGLTAWRRSS